MHFLDLPILARRPDYAALRAAVDELTAGDVTEDFEGTAALDKGTRQWLASLATNELEWIDEEPAEALRAAAARRLSEQCGVTATAARRRRLELAQGVSVVLDEPGMTEDLLGQLTWGSSLVLARRLVREPALVANKTVLELGAGTGLVGIAAKQVGAQVVHVTDLPEIVPNLARNVEANGGQCAAYALDWAAPVLPPDHPVFDVCLISDPVYSREHPAMLLRAVEVVDAHSVLLQLPLRRGFEQEREHIWTGLPRLGYTQIEAEEEAGRDLFGEQAFSYTRWARS